MEALGELIIGLHRNLEEIRASLDTTGAAHNTQQGLLLQSTIDRAEGALRKQAREICASAQGPPVAVGPTHGFGRLPSPNTAAQASRRAVPSGGPVPPQRSRSPAPPGAGCDARAGSADFVRQRPLRAPTQGSRSRAKTSAHQRLLPKPNRLDPLADPPAITERDLDSGLLNLSTRGFIPQSADLTPAMERGVPVMQQRPAPLYDQALRRERREIAPADDLLAVRLDPNGPPRQARGASEEPSARGQRQHLPPLKPPPLSPAASLRALPAPPAESDAAAAAPAASVAQSYGTFCTELLEASPDDAGALVPVSRGPSQAEIRTAAATRIAAAWRGCKQRRRYLALLTADRAARRIQSAWLAAMTRMATKLQLGKIQEGERKLHTRLMYELGQDWFQTKQHRRIEIHICSITVSETRRRRTDGFQEFQASQIGRIFRLMDPRRDIIFVAPRHLHEDILEYYSKIMQFRGIKNPPGRFQVVVPEHTDLNPRLSLTQALLCSPKALKRLRKLTNGRQAYVIPGMVTHAELKLCGQLKLPLMGAGPRNMVLLSSKSNCKKLAQLAELPTGPWAVDIYDEDEFFTSLAGLIVKHPQVRTWLFKIDDERASRGHAYIDLWKLREVSDSLRTSVQAGGGGGTDSAAALRANADEPAVLGADANEVRQLLRRHVPKRAVLCNRGAYPDFAAWLAEASRVGAVIQAVPDEIVAQTSVHLQIEPDGSTTVLGTSEAIMCNQFVRAASWFPHTRGSWEVLHEAGIRMGRTLAAKGLMGFASVDVVFFENPDFDAAILAQQEREPTPQVIGGAETPVDQQHLMFRDLRSPSPEMSSPGDDGRGPSPGAVPSLPESRQADYDLAVHLQSHPSGLHASDPVSMMLGAPSQVGVSPASRYGCWVVDVDARLTEEASALFPLQFIAQVKLEPNSGTFRVTGEAAQHQQQQQTQTQQEDGADHLTEGQRGERLNRWAIASAGAIAPGLEKMSYQTLFQAAKMRGVSFDLFHNIGCVFTFLDVFHSLFSLLAVEKTPENCIKRLASAAGTVTEGTASQNPQQRGQPGRSGDMADGLSAADLQMALRMAQRKMAERAAK